MNQYLVSIRVNVEAQDKEAAIEAAIAAVLADFNAAVSDIEAETVIDVDFMGVTSDTQSRRGGQ